MAHLLDTDGTLLDAGRAIDGAVDAVRRLREARVPFLFATNTSRKSRGDVAASLREAGIDADDDEVLSASFAAAELLRRRGVRRVRLLLPRSACADYADFLTTADDPEAVVVGDIGPEVTFDALNEAFRALRRGARLVATQKNRYWKAADGPTLDAGAFVAALEYAARVDAEIVGKPAPGFFRAAAEMLGVEASSLTIVGDDVESDVAGGKRAGLGTILVRTGKFDAARWAELPEEQRPDRVLDSIADVPDHVA
jgi:HAD superfamily hydrolase (TIGR01458 family)